MNSKIVTRSALKKILTNRYGKNVGFTSGAFDLLHVGHVDYLNKAKNKCDILVVGVNTDSSIKEYKGKDRPIIGEKDRLKMVASLQSVDYVFLFNERRNKKNIEELRPQFYIKAGDYNKNELTSAKYLKPWNGKVILIPPVKGTSTSEIIDKIKNIGEGHAPKLKRPAIFIDRDGTINKEIHFLHEPDKFKLLPEVLEGLKLLQKMKFRLIIVTNQCGIGLGYFSKEDLFRVNSKMLKIFSNNDIIIDKIYFCPHSLSEKCNCRKPETGLFIRGKKDLNIDMKQSYTIGDNLTDIEAGKKAGTKTILIGNIKSKHKPDYNAKHMLDAANWIKKDFIK